MEKLALILLFAHSSFTLTYRAAVLEHNILKAATPKDTIYKNLGAYRYYANQAKAENAQILVFPEYGLTSTNAVANLAEHATEVSNDSYIIKEFRAIARLNAMYLVVNLLEKERESDKKTKYYNTNLVFDRSGDVILKYRKINLFQEPGVTPGDPNQVLSFTTDFGVTFGIFTCFDILWENPSQRVLADGHVTDIVYPTAWIAVMPFHTPLSIQHGYSLANGVNLLAADYDHPGKGLGGSGIYLASGRIAESYISGIPSSKLLVQDVPKLIKREDKTQCASSNVSLFVTKLSGLPNEDSFRSFFTQNGFTNKSLYKYQNLDLRQLSSSHKICHNEFCCTFDISLDNKQTYFSDNYKLMAYDGWVSFFDFKGHVRVCSLLVCQDDSHDSCGTRIDSPVRFEKILVKGHVENKDSVFFRPISLNYYLQPIEDTVYCEPKEETDFSVVELTTTKPQRGVLAFGVIGKVTKVYISGSTRASGVLFVIVLTVGKYILI